MSVVDDYGLFDARPSILRAQLFPLRIDRVREADISRWLAACEKAGLILLYEAGGKQFLWMLNTEWAGRAEPKYPLPPNTELVKTGKTSFHLRASENTCTQMHADARNRAQVRLYSDSYSDPNSETYSDSLSRAREAPPFQPEFAEPAQQTAAIDEIAKLLCDLHEVRDNSGWQLRDKLQALAVELHGVQADTQTVRAFWAHRRVKPQLQYFVQDFVTWRAGQKGKFNGNGKDSSKPASDRWKSGTQL